MWEQCQDDIETLTLQLRDLSHPSVPSESLLPLSCLGTQCSAKAKKKKKRERFEKVSKEKTQITLSLRWTHDYDCWKEITWLHRHRVMGEAQGQWAEQSRAPSYPSAQAQDVSLEKSFALYERLNFVQGLQIFF